MTFTFGFFCGVSACVTVYYLLKLVCAIWLGPMLDKYDRGHP